MNQIEKKAIGLIYYLANDKRSHLLLTDQVKWLEQKLKEIKNISSLLSKVKFDGIIDSAFEIKKELKNRKK